MTHRQQVATTTLLTVGAAAVAVPLGLVVLHLLDVPGMAHGFGLYRVLALALGCALIARGRELRSADAWSYFDSWWKGSAPDRRVMLGRIAGIVVQLALLLLLIRTFEIENPIFWTRIAPLTLGGCIIHHLTPSRHRLAMFLFLSLAAVWVVFSTSDALWLMAIGIGLVALCHLPIPFWTRAAGVVIAGAALAAARVEWMPVPWSRAIWPILGSMFMFRMIVYLYDLKHEKVPASWPQRLAYFFLLPNVVFPLFPVVDYGTFRRTYYDAEAYRIYQRGIEWIFRGILQLVIYRLIYQHLTIEQGEVRSVAGIAQFVLTNFLLYLRVSGQFHMIVGMLHLFGFHLPETHRRYLLASSFSDLWRRINIYWTDFMTKVFYYPVLFKMRRFGERRSMIVATLVVFLATWALHSYQWFWILGSFPITVTDAVFWSILAALLMASTLYEARYGRLRTIAARVWTPRLLAVQGLKIGGTIGLLSVLWSLWMSPSFGEWLALWSVDRVATLPHLPSPQVWLVGILLTGVSVLPGSRWTTSFTMPTREWSFARSVAISAASIIALLLVGQPAITSRLGAGVGDTIASLRTPQLNKQDATRLTRGYYEDLMGVSRFNSQLWEVYMQRPPAEAWPMLAQTEAVRPTNDFLKTQFVPNARINFLGAILTINRWGMRDKDYTLAKPPGVRRFALIGASVDMGWGVADDESYEQILEQRLNAGKVAGSRGRYEVLNFSEAGHTVADHLLILDRVFTFEPDVVIIPARGVDASRMVEHVFERRKAGVPIVIDSLRAAVEASGFGRVPDAVAMKRLEAHQDELLEWLYVEIARRVRERGALPLFVFVPSPDRTYTAEEIKHFSIRAAQAGFAVLDISDAYRGYDLKEIRLAEFDRHPNVKGHHILADRLYRALLANPKILGVPR